MIKGKEFNPAFNADLNNDRLGMGCPKVRRWVRFPSRIWFLGGLLTFGFAATYPSSLWHTSAEGVIPTDGTSPGGGGVPS